MDCKEFNEYMAQMEGDLLFHLYKEEDSIQKRPIKMASITIPGDRQKFNKMWLNKEFDKIDPATHVKINPLSLRYGLYHGRYEWDEYFFKKREELMYTDAVKLWETSEYYTVLSLEIFRIYESAKCLCSLFDVKNYFSSSPNDVMFPNTMISHKYSHPILLRIYSDTITRFQCVATKMNNERISIYMPEILALSKKIQIIQTIIYFGFEETIHIFKSKKDTCFAKFDTEITDIEPEPNEFIDCNYKSYLYKFYLICISKKTTTKEIKLKLGFLAQVLTDYEYIQQLVTNYIPALCLLIRQNKLNMICCQNIMDYLKPIYITDRYIVTKFVLLLTI